MVNKFINGYMESGIYGAMEFIRWKRSADAGETRRRRSVLIASVSDTPTICINDYLLRASPVRRAGGLL